MLRHQSKGERLWTGPVRRRVDSLLRYRVTQRAMSRRSSQRIYARPFVLGKAKMRFRGAFVDHSADCGACV